MAKGAQKRYLMGGVKVDESQVISTVTKAIDDARAFIDWRIAVERAAAYDYYYGRPFGNELEGRSQIVSNDVAQSVDSVLPALMKIFVGGDKAVEFTPRGQEDVKNAEYATLCCNYVFFSQNNGYALTHDFIKDGLLQKIGVFKWEWVTEKKKVSKRLKGLTDEQLQALDAELNGKGKIVEHTEYPDPVAQVALMTSPEGVIVPGQPPKLHDVKVEIIKKDGKVKIVVPAPEEILISPDAEGLDVQAMPFVCHRVRLTKSDLLAMGYPRIEVEQLPVSNDGMDDGSEIVKQARETTGDNVALSWGTDFITYDECYIRIDEDGDGIDELRKICMVGRHILHDEEIDHIPLAMWCPKVMPHETIGVSLADEVMDIQLLKSTIWRGAMDNFYMTIAPRMFAQGQIRLDDVLTVKPGGIIRGEPGATLTPIVMPSLIGEAFNMLEYADQEEEVRTGISRMFQGIDPQAINKTATGVNALLNQAGARVELMARNAAEFGFKPLFRGILYLLSKNQTEELFVRLTNSFMPVDPEAWNKEYDMSTNVGLGVGTKDQQLIHLQALGMDLQAIGQSPFGQQLLDAKKVYNYVSKKMELAGFKDATTFVNDPGMPGEPNYKEPPVPQKPPEIQKAEMELQADAQKFRAKAQLDQQARQQDMIAQSHQARLDMELEREKMALQAQMERYKAEQEVMIEQFKIEKQAELERYKAELAAKAELESAQMKAQSTVKAAYVSAKMDDPENEDVKAERQRERQEQRDLLMNIAALIAQSNRPKEIVRGKDGRAIGVRPI